MATLNTATHKRSVLDSQPLLKRSSEANGQKERQKENRHISLSDAGVVAQYLNDAKQAKARASYDKVRRIHGQLAELRETRLKLHDESHFPGDRITDAKLYEETLRKAHDLARSLNEQLRRYVFRPQVSYGLLPGSMSILQALWAGGMVPDRKGFETAISGCPVSEADAALALVRLDLNGDLTKLGLCEMCQERWRVASKRSYRFCSKECREGFYTKAPDYHERKARTQREYRKRLRGRI